VLVLVSVIVCVCLNLIFMYINVDVLPLELCFSLLKNASNRRRVRLLLHHDVV
jgi:hypothetical protein